MTSPALQRWHSVAQSNDASQLPGLIARDAVFLSPVVHTPQRGKALVVAYLSAAFDVFFNDSFRYVREVEGEQGAVLEFEVEIDGVSVNGVDMIRWDADGQIVEFKVMVRPLKAIQLIHQKMGEILARQQQQQQ